MISIIRNEVESLKADRKTLRKFGLTFFVILNIIAGYLYWKSSPNWPWLSGVSGLFLLSGLFLPFLLKPFYKVWMAFAFVLGWIMTRAILTITFFLMFTPMAFLLRILDKDLLDLKIDRNASTYWRSHEPISDKSRYLKQY